MSKMQWRNLRAYLQTVLAKSSREASKDEAFFEDSSDYAVLSDSCSLFFAVIGFRR